MKAIKIPEGFERLIKGEKLGGLPFRTISLHAQTKRVTFSKDLGKYLKNFWGIEVFINRSKKIILFIPSNNQVKACRITRPSNSNNNYTSFSIFSTAFRNENLEDGEYPVRFNFGKIEFDYKLIKQKGTFL